jgi:tagaturonate epimerase
MILEKLSFGVGDRFGQEGCSQLQALQLAEKDGIVISPVWNKSHREHSIIGTVPADTRTAADSAVRDCKWTHPYYVDADHISLKTVDLFNASSDFFTLDVADFIGTPADVKSVEAFVHSVRKFEGRLEIPGVHAALNVTEDDIRAVGKKYLLAVQEAGKIYRHIASVKGAETFVTEVSTDEALQSQTPTELFFILAAIAQESIPIQTIAPKFTGKFLKGIDYVGQVEQFTGEFEDDLCVIAFAVKTFHLPANLKLSIHSGSDKFSLYPSIHRIIGKHNAGLHLKTAGTTWLEELIGLAMSGGKGFAISQKIYGDAYKRIDELCRPYESVIEIDRRLLPEPKTVNGWNKDEFVAALRHDQSNPKYNLHFRQLLHLAYKLAAEMGDDFTRAVDRSREYVGRNVTENLFQRHIKPLFLGQ